MTQGSVRDTTGYVNYVYNISARGTTQVASQLMGLSNVTGSILGQLAFQTSSYLSSTEGALLSMGIVATAGFSKATQKASEFDQALSTIGAISGKTRSEVSGLGDQAIAMSNKFGMAVGEMTTGLEALARAGVSTGNMNAILEQAMGLSKLEGLSLETAINSLISTTNLLDTAGLDLESPEYAEAVKRQNQRITATSEAAPINAQDIIHTLEHVGGYASSTNLDQDDLFAVIAQLGSKGTKSEMAGTSLRAFLAAGQKDTAQRALKRIGLEVSDLWKNDDTIMSITDMKDVLDQAMEAKGYTKQEKLEFYSDFAGYKQANQIMKIDTNSVREFKDKIDRSWDMGKKIEQVIGTTETHLQGLVQAGTNLLIKVGEPFLPIVSTIAATLKTGIDIINMIPGSNFIIAGGLVLASVKAISTVFNKIVPQLVASKGHIGGISGLFKTIRSDLQESFTLIKNINNSDFMKQRSREIEANRISEQDKYAFWESKTNTRINNMSDVWRLEREHGFKNDDQYIDWKKREAKKPLKKEKEPRNQRKESSNPPQGSTSSSNNREDNKKSENLRDVAKSIDNLKEALQNINFEFDNTIIFTLSNNINKLTESINNIKTDKLETVSVDNIKIDDSIFKDLKNHIFKVEVLNVSRIVPVHEVGDNKWNEQRKADREISDFNRRGHVEIHDPLYYVAGDKSSGEIAGRGNHTTRIIQLNKKYEKNKGTTNHELGHTLLLDNRGNRESDKIKTTNLTNEEKKILKENKLGHKSYDTLGKIVDEYEADLFAIKYLEKKNEKIPKAKINRILAAEKVLKNHGVLSDVRGDYVDTMVNAAYLNKSMIDDKFNHPTFVDFKESKTEKPKTEKPKLQGPKLAPPFVEDNNSQENVRSLTINDTEHGQSFVLDNVIPIAKTDLGYNENLGKPIKDALKELQEDNQLKDIDWRDALNKYYVDHNAKKLQPLIEKIGRNAIGEDSNATIDDIMNKGHDIMNKASLQHAANQSSDALIIPDNQLMKLSYERTGSESIDEVQAWVEQYLYEIQEQMNLVTYPTDFKGTIESKTKEIEKEMGIINSIIANNAINLQKTNPSETQEMRTLGPPIFNFGRKLTLATMKILDDSENLGLDFDIETKTDKNGKKITRADQLKTKVLEKYSTDVERGQLLDNLNSIYDSSLMNTFEDMIEATNLNRDQFTKLLIDEMNKSLADEDGGLSTLAGVFTYKNDSNKILKSGDNSLSNLVYSLLKSFNEDKDNTIEFLNNFKDVVEEHRLDSTELINITTETTQNMNQKRSIIEQKENEIIDMTMGYHESEADYYGQLDTMSTVVNKTGAGLDTDSGDIWDNETYQFKDVDTIYDEIDEGLQDKKNRIQAMRTKLYNLEHAFDTDFTNVDPYAGINFADMTEEQAAQYLEKFKNKAPVEFMTADTNTKYYNPSHRIKFGYDMTSMGTEAIFNKKTYPYHLTATKESLRPHIENLSRLRHELQNIAEFNVGKKTGMLHQQVPSQIKNAYGPAYELAGTGQWTRRQMGKNLGISDTNSLVQATKHAKYQTMQRTGDNVITGRVIGISDAENDKVNDRLISKLENASLRSIWTTSLGIGVKGAIPENTPKSKLRPIIDDIFDINGDPIGYILARYSTSKNKFGEAAHGRVPSINLFTELADAQDRSTHHVTQDEAGRYSYVESPEQRLKRIVMTDTSNTIKAQGMLATHDPAYDIEKAKGYLSPDDNVTPILTPANIANIARTQLTTQMENVVKNMFNDQQFTNLKDLKDLVGGKKFKEVTQTIRNRMLAYGVDGENKINQFETWASDEEIKELENQHLFDGIKMKSRTGKRIDKDGNEIEVVEHLIFDWAALQRTEDEMAQSFTTTLISRSMLAVEEATKLKAQSPSAFYGLNKSLTSLPSEIKKNPLALLGINSRDAINLAGTDSSILYDVIIALKELDSLDPNEIEEYVSKMSLDDLDEDKINGLQELGYYFSYDDSNNIIGIYNAANELVPTFEILYSTLENIVQQSKMIYDMNQIFDENNVIANQVKKDTLTELAEIDAKKYKISESDAYSELARNVKKNEDYILSTRAPYNRISSETTIGDLTSADEFSQFFTRGVVGDQVLQPVTERHISQLPMDWEVRPSQISNGTTDILKPITQVIKPEWMIQEEERKRVTSNTKNINTSLDWNFIDDGLAQPTYAGIGGTGGLTGNTSLPPYKEEYLNSEGAYKGKKGIAPRQHIKISSGRSLSKEDPLSLALIGKKLLPSENLQRQVDDYKNMPNWLHSILRDIDMAKVENPGKVKPKKRVIDNAENTPMWFKSILKAIDENDESGIEPIDDENEELNVKNNPKKKISDSFFNKIAHLPLKKQQEIMLATARKYMDDLDELVQKVQENPDISWEELGVEVGSPAFHAIKQLVTLPETSYYNQVNKNKKEGFSFPVQEPSTSTDEMVEGPNGSYLVKNVGSKYEFVDSGPTTEEEINLAGDILARHIATAILHHMGISDSDVSENTTEQTTNNSVTPIGYFGQQSLPTYDDVLKEQYAGQYKEKVKNLKDNIFDKITLGVNKIYDTVGGHNNSKIVEPLSKTSKALGDATVKLEGFTQFLQNASDHFAPLITVVIALEGAIFTLKSVLEVTSGLEEILKLQKTVNTTFKGKTFDLFGSTFQKDSNSAKILLSISSVLGTIIETVTAFLGPLLLLASAFVVTKKALDWSYQSHQKYIKQLEEEEKTNKSKSKSLQLATEQSKKAYMKNRNGKRDEVLERRYLLDKQKLDSANLRRTTGAMKLTSADNDTLWGKYGIASALDKIQGKYESTAADYDGTTSQLRRIKEHTTGGQSFMRGLPGYYSPAEERVSAYYDANKLAFGIIDEYKDELGELYDTETKAMKKNPENSRETIMFQKALDKFVEATGITKEHAQQYLDYMQTEHNVDNATQAMQAQADMISAQTEMKIQAISFGGNPADVLGLNGIEAQQNAMVQAQADMIKLELSSQLWWKAVWSTITSPIRAIISPIFAIAHTLAAIWAAITGNWDNAGMHMKQAGASLNVLGETATYWGAWATAEGTDFSSIGNGAIDESDRANYGNAPTSSGGGGTHVPNPKSNAIFGFHPVGWPFSEQGTGAHGVKEHQAQTAQNAQQSFLGALINPIFEKIAFIASLLMGISALLIAGPLVGKGLSKLFESDMFGKGLSDGLSNIIKSKFGFFNTDIKDLFGIRSSIAAYKERPDLFEGSFIDKIATNSWFNSIKEKYQSGRNTLSGVKDKYVNPWIEYGKEKYQSGKETLDTVKDEYVNPWSTYLSDKFNEKKEEKKNKIKDYWVNLKSQAELYNTYPTINGESTFDLEGSKYPSFAIKGLAKVLDLKNKGFGKNAETNFGELLSNPKEFLSDPHKVEQMGRDVYNNYRMQYQKAKEDPNAQEEYDWYKEGGALRFADLSRENKIRAIGDKLSGIKTGMFGMEEGESVREMLKNPEHTMEVLRNGYQSIQENGLIESLGLNEDFGIEDSVRDKVSGLFDKVKEGFMEGIDEDDENQSLFQKAKKKLAGLLGWTKESDTSEEYNKDVLKEEMDWYKAGEIDFTDLTGINKYKATDPHLERDVFGKQKREHYSSDYLDNDDEEEVAEIQKESRFMRAKRKMAGLLHRNKEAEEKSQDEEFTPIEKSKGLLDTFKQIHNIDKDEMKEEMSQNKMAAKDVLSGRAFGNNVKYPKYYDPNLTYKEGDPGAAEKSASVLDIVGEEDLSSVGDLTKKITGGKGGKISNLVKGGISKLGKTGAGKAIGGLGKRAISEVSSKLATKGIAQIGSKVLGGALMATGIGAPLGLLLESPLGGFLIEGAMNLGGKALGAVGGAFKGIGKFLGIGRRPIGSGKGLLGGMMAMSPIGMAAGLLGGIFGGKGSRNMGKMFGSGPLGLMKMVGPLGGMVGLLGSIFNINKKSTKFQESIDKHTGETLQTVKAQNSKQQVSSGSGGNITIQNININTQDDPEAIKAMFLELIIELQEQVNPRLVSRTAGKPSNSTSNTDTNTDESSDEENISNVDANGNITSNRGH